MLKPDMPVVFDSHALEQRYRLRAVQADTPPMVVSDVPDVRVYMESLGLEFLERPAFDKLPAAVLALLGSHKDHPVLPKAKRELVLSGGQPLDKCRLVYWNDFEPAVFARKRLRAGELLGVVACQVLVHSDIPDDDATVWEVESQPELYTGPALYFCTRAAGNLFRFVRNARLTSRAANVITRQLWIDGRPHMAIEAVESIATGTELLLDFGADTTASLLRRNLVAMGLASHALHGRLLELRQQLALARIAEPVWPAQGVAGQVVVVLSCNRVLFDCVELNCTRIFDLALRRLMPCQRRRPDAASKLERRNGESARDSADGAADAGGDGDDRDGSAAAAGSTDAFAHALRDVDWAAALEHVALRVDGDAASQLSRWALPEKQSMRHDGHSDALVAKRVDLLHHPRRWLTVPCADAFCVVAAMAIPRMRPIVACAGMPVPGDASLYRFDVIGPRINAPMALVAPVNCTAQLLWNESTAGPTLALLASAGLRAGDEVAFDDTLREPGTREMALHLQHLKYWYRALGRVLQLEGELTQRGLAVPPCASLVTSYAPNTDTVWVRDDTLYPEGVIDYDACDVRVAHVITDARVVRNDEREYCVQWRGLDPSWGAWLTEDDSALKQHGALVESYRNGGERAKAAFMREWKKHFLHQLAADADNDIDGAEAAQPQLQSSPERSAPAQETHAVFEVAVPVEASSAEGDARDEYQSPAKRSKSGNGMDGDDEPLSLFNEAVKHLNDASAELSDGVEDDDGGGAAPSAVQAATAKQSALDEYLDQLLDVLVADVDDGDGGGGKKAPSARIDNAPKRVRADGVDVVEHSPNSAVMREAASAASIASSDAKRHRVDSDGVDSNGVDSNGVVAAGSAVGGPDRRDALLLYLRRVDAIIEHATAERARLLAALEPFALGEADQRDAISRAHATSRKQ